MVVGLFGGSFNPPHPGHRLVAEIALKRLGLDQLWWMVTPGNPLKSRSVLLPLAERIALSRDLALSFLSSPAARALSFARVDENAARSLGLRRPPAWTFIHGPRSTLSSTEIRQAARPVPMPGLREASGGLRRALKD